MSKSKNPVATYPLRNLVVTLMLYKNPDEELLTDEQIVEYLEMSEPGFLRGQWHVQDAAKRFGLTIADVTVGYSTGGEMDGYDVTLMFVRGAEVVLMDLNCPGYCDDESDACVTALSDVLTREQAQRDLEDNITAFRAKVEETLTRQRNEHAKLFGDLPKAA